VIVVIPAFAKTMSSLPFSPPNLCEGAIKVVRFRDISLYAGYILSDLFYRVSQLRFAPPRDENISAFVHKLLRRSKADAAISTGK
jgi:hypothetical protein